MILLVVTSGYIDSLKMNFYFTLTLPVQNPYNPIRLKKEYYFSFYHGNRNSLSVGIKGCSPDSFVISVATG